MKLVNYRCNNCGREVEYIYQDSEWEIVFEAKEHDVLDECICGGELKKFNFKNNKQQWKFMDGR